ncbi:MAG TPA: D-2-hydroxyacid dehydrogenase [Candidatus Sulfopaludibacter sp.]|jgi:phosphoglycerate dehydrogenase-like enzyme|nr:D-2-hydroxyacid dehydrogenase [Candidatus Sulfopaludibacter sp.]
MDNQTVLVLANPAEPQLAMLEELPPQTNLAVGNHPDAFTRTAADATVIFNWSGSRALLQEVFRMCPRVQWVHSRSAGLDTVLFPELVAHPVPLTNGSGVFSPSLGEFVLGAILYFAKDFRRMIRHQQAGEFEPFDIAMISGTIGGILGYGDIGRACATRMRALGMRVLAVKRSAPPVNSVDPLVEQIYSPEQRIEMIQRCDYIVVAAPLTESTRGMLGPAEFAAMKPTAVVINVGRGPVIDEAAMVQALSQGTIKGAALDVFDQEPLPPGHPFYKLENVLLSAHCADHTPDWMDLAMRFFLDQFARFTNGEPLLNVVNKQLGY